MATRKSACCPEYDPVDNTERVQTNDKYKRVKIVCKSCGSYIKYDTSDKNRAALEERRKLIDAMLELQSREGTVPFLSEKQTTFLSGIYDRVNLTPGQYGYFENLKAIYQLKVGNPASSRNEPTFSD